MKSKSALRLRVKFDFVGATRENYIVRVIRVKHGRAATFSSNHKRTYRRIDDIVMVNDVTNQMSGPLDCP